MEINIWVELPPTNRLKMFSTSKSIPAKLTTKYNTSDYKLPVVLVDGQVYSPAELDNIYPNYELVAIADYEDWGGGRRIITDDIRNMINLAEQVGYSVYKY